MCDSNIFTNEDRERKALAVIRKLDDAGMEQVEMFAAGVHARAEYERRREELRKNGEEEKSA